MHTVLLRSYRSADPIRLLVAEDDAEAAAAALADGQPGEDDATA